MLAANESSDSRRPKPRVPDAMAQTDTYDNGQGDSYTTTQELTVTGERHARSSIGAPIEWVSTERRIDTSDLDLSTPWGAHELRMRVEKAAQTACFELDTFHPVTADDSPDCYKAAVRDALAQAEDATGYKLASY